MTERRLLSVRDVEEAVGVLSLFVHFGHEGVALEKVFAVYEKIQGACLWQLDSLPDDVVKVIRRQIVRNQILGLVNIRQLGCLTFLTNHGNSIVVSVLNFISFGLALL